MAGMPKRRARARTASTRTRYRYRNTHGATPWFDTRGEANDWLDRHPSALGGPAMTIMIEQDPPTESTRQRQREAAESRARSARAQEQADAEAYRRHLARMRAARGRR